MPYAALAERHTAVVAIKNLPPSMINGTTPAAVSLTSGLLESVCVIPEPAVLPAVLLALAARRRRGRAGQAGSHPATRACVGPPTRVS